MDNELVFVICPPRSGSTMLARILAGHSAIYCRPEPQLIAPIHQLGYYGNVKNPGWHGDTAAYIPSIVRNSIHSIVADLPRGEEDYLDALRAYLNTLYGRLLAASGKRLFVDKTPRNTQFVQFILKLYPKARFLVLTRHPVALGLSLCRLARTIEGYNEAQATAEAITLRTLPLIISDVAEVLRAPGAPVCHLRFEDLVRSPEETMTRACNFLGLELEPAMLEYGGMEWKGPGDPFTVGKHERPEASYADDWKDEVAKHPEQATFARDLMKLLREELVSLCGYSAPEINASIEAAALSGANP